MSRLSGTYARFHARRADPAVVERIVALLQHEGGAIRQAGDEVELNIIARLRRLFPEEPRPTIGQVYFACCALAQSGRLIVRPKGNNHYLKLVEDGKVEKPTTQGD